MTPNKPLLKKVLKKIEEVLKKPEVLNTEDGLCRACGDMVSLNDGCEWPDKDGPICWSCLHEDDRYLREQMNSLRRIVKELCK